MKRKHLHSFFFQKNIDLVYTLIEYVPGNADCIRHGAVGEYCQKDHKNCLKKKPPKL